jgi:uncharacterized protein (DUF362 family)
MLQVYDATEWEASFYTPAILLQVATVTMLAQSEWKPKHNAVFIKPNIGATSFYVNTDPSVVRGLIHYLRGIGITDVIVGEGAVETEYESTGYNFHHQGWDDLANQENVELLDLNKCERVAVPWQYGEERGLESLMLPRALENRSYINVAKLKTHMQTLVSLCTKNQKGLLNSATRKKFHKWGLHEPIARLTEAVSPELCVVDGYYGIEGNGPGDWGTRKKVGLLIAGDSMVEVDSACCGLMGISPDEVEHLKIFRRMTGFSTVPINLSKRGSFRRPSPSFRKFKTHLRPENACTACLSSVGKMNKLARKSWAGVKVFSRKGLLTRLDIVVGSPKDVPRRHGYLVFYGDCAKKLASRYSEYPFIQGCPPISQRALEQLSRD